jgi:alkanesulfonate monooxygenase SsuD/methylene tetrahydromethanopterin reductase-like flavin-dependent oxidoreductase (luciferase family)
MKAFGQAGSYLGDVTGGVSEDRFSYDYLAENTILHGSPETVIRKIEAFRDVGATSIMVHYPPYYGLEQTLDMLRLFAKEVLPHLREMQPAAE